MRSDILFALLLFTATLSSLLTLLTVALSSPWRRHWLLTLLRTHRIPPPPPHAPLVRAQLEPVPLSLFVKPSPPANPVCGYCRLRPSVVWWPGREPAWSCRACIQYLMWPPSHPWRLERE